jgi:hypothetical protein
VRMRLGWSDGRWLRVEDSGAEYGVGTLAGQRRSRAEDSGAERGRVEDSGAERGRAEDSGAKVAVHRGHVDRQWTQRQ